MNCLARRAALWLLLFTGVLAACPVRGQAQDIDELLQKARAAQSSGNYADAAGLYARAAQLSPSTPELWANRGVMEYLAGRMEASTISLKHALRLNPDLFTPMLFLGKAYVRLSKPAVALPWLSQAHTLKPADVEVLLTLAKANADLNQQRQAASLYADTVRIAPENQAAWLGLGAASLEVITVDGRALAATAAQSIWAHSLYADELFAQGRPLEAVDTYMAATAAATPPQKATLLRNLEWMRTHPDLFPIPTGSQQALLQLMAQLESGQAIAGSPSCGHQATLIERAACAYWAGEYEQCAAKAGEQLHRSAQDPEALYWSVKASERLAVAAFARYEELAPQSATTYVMVGDLYRYRRQMDSALGEYRKALSIDAHAPAALLGTVVADLSANKLEEAIVVDGIALADRPLDPQLNLLMAEILAAENQFDQARPYLEKCLSSPPELQSRVHYLLGRANAEDGNTEEAIHQFELAMPADKDGSLHYQLSRLYRKVGKLAQAQQAEQEAKVLIRHRDENAAIAVREATGHD